MKTAVRPLFLVAALTGLFLLLFDVTPRFEFALPREVAEPDPAREAEFDACFAARDDAIHEEAFGTIDNPDVQREFISMRREEAERDCRERFPARTVMVSEPFRFNLVDVRFRFADQD